MITLKDIRDAAKRVAPYTHRTPVMISHQLNRMFNAEICFKCENFQKIGAFKIRGATNAVMSLSVEEAAKGVATHSSGNHAQAVSLAARNRGITAHIVMPSNAKAVKLAAVKGYGGEVTLCAPTLAAREATLEKILEKTGAHMIHPYNDWRIIAGQATCALEILDDGVRPDIIVTPVGGGGLMSGTALATHYIHPGTKVIAAEPEKADDAHRSFTSGKLQPSVDPQTVCDGLLTSLGNNTFSVMMKHVSAVLTVSEDNIIAAMRLIWERLKIVVEPSAAVTLAAVMQYPDRFQDQTVALILTGGNVDLADLPW